MRRKPYPCVLILLILLPCAASAQYMFRHFSTENGFSSDQPVGVVQDSEGLIWVANKYGLERFDGHDVFNPARLFQEYPSPLSSQAVAIDRHDNLWLGTTKGLYCYNPRFHRLNYYSEGSAGQRLFNNFVAALFADRRDRIWIGHWFGLSYYDHTTGKLTHIPFPNRSGELYATCVSALYVDEQTQKVYAGTWGGILYVLDIKTNKLSDFENHPDAPKSKTAGRINSIMQDSRGDLWICTWDNGLYHYNISTDNFEHYTTGQHPRLSDSRIHDIEQYDENRYWIATENGITILDLANRQTELIRYDPYSERGISQNVINSVFKDRQGGIWACTRDNGANYYHPSQYQFKTIAHARMKTNPAGSPAFTISLFEFPRRHIWINTNSGTMICDLHTNSWYTPARKGYNLPEGLEIGSMCHLADGQIAIGCKNEVYLCSPDMRYCEVLAIPDSSQHPLNQFKIAAQVDSLHVVLSSSIGGTYVLNPQTKVLSLLRPVGLKALVTGKYNGQTVAWMKEAQGLNAYFASLDTLETGHNPGTCDENLIQYMDSDSKGRIWVGTTHRGLARWIPKQCSLLFDSITQAALSGPVFRLLVDKNDNVWLFTDKGIACRDFKTGRLTLYNTKDGLGQNNQSQGAILLTEEGYVVFSGVNAIQYVHPDSVSTNTQAPRAVITRMQIFSQDVMPGPESPLKTAISATRKISLKHNQNYITLYFAALNYLIPEKNHYAWTLEGMDNQWHYSRDENKAVYSNLNPGTYTFRLKASNNDGIWSETPTTLVITIRPPWWNTLLFRIMLIVISFIVILLWIRVRTFRLKHQGEYLKKQVALRTYELEQTNAVLLEKQEEVSLQNEEILRRTVQVEEMARLLHETDQMKLRFFTNISHEIRTPLTLIIGPVENLLQRIRSVPVAEIEKQLKLTQRSAKRLLSLINQLLDFRKIDQGKLRLNVGEYDIVHTISEIHEAFLPYAEKLNIRFLYKTSQESFTAWFDADILQKVMYNLLSNAFKYTPDGGTVGITLTVGGPYLAIQTADTGIGIAPDKQALIFDRFYQVDHNVFERQKGSGIGLAYTKEIVELHHGRIEVNSTPGEGSAFTVYLPADKEQYAENELALATPEPDLGYIRNLIAGTLDEKATEPPEPLSHPDDLQKPLVLVVEDNADVRQFIRQCLETSFQIAESPDGMAGFDKALAIEPALVLSDVTMPVMDGTVLCQKLKTDPRTSHLPVVLLTARITEEEQLAGLQTGADDYITKPFSPALLTARLQNLIAQRIRLRQTFASSPDTDVRALTFSEQDELFLQRAIAFVEQNLSNADLSNDEFIQALGTSKTLAYNKLKSITDQSVSEFIRTIRLKKGAELLRNTNYNVAEIAYMTGFKAPSHFTRYFTQQFGIQPSRYKENDV